MNQSQRPLSPHLQIYRPQITSMMSILHRLTGLLLMSAPLLLVIALATVKAGPVCYEKFWAFIQYPLVQIYLFFLCYGLFYHTCHGIRHLVWDSGLGFEMATVRWSGWLAHVVSITLTFVTWFLLKGGL